MAKRVNEIDEQEIVYTTVFKVKLTEPRGVWCIISIFFFFPRREMFFIHYGGISRAQAITLYTHCYTISENRGRYGGVGTVSYLLRIPRVARTCVITRLRLPVYRATAVSNRFQLLNTIGRDNRPTFLVLSFFFFFPFSYSLLLFSFFFLFLIYF